MRVLVVDDNASNVRLVSRIDDCSVVGFTDPVKALAAVGDTPIDLALVDYMMPEIDGLEFIGKLRGMPGSEDIPIVIVTAAGSVRYAALDAGATDFLTKPIDPVEAKSRIRNMRRLRDSQNRLRDQVTWLAREVKKATGALAAREEEIIFRLSRAAEYRDNDTGDHIVRVAKYCRLIGEALSLDEKSCRDLYLAAPMHDVGKIAVGDAILLKPGMLSSEERLVMQRHTLRGYEILSNSESELINLAADIARCHHERWDGTGYPRGLRGDEIPLFARITAVADVFDALTTARPYKAAWTPVKARASICEGAGRHFDPACVEAFLQRWDNVLVICGRERNLQMEVA